MAHTSYRTAPADLNQLKRGASYLATTPIGAISGEYLGIEAPHGDWSILLRHTGGTHSIGLDALTAIEEII
jgi:hypothetical protein